MWGVSVFGNAGCAFIWASPHVCMRRQKPRRPFAICIPWFLKHLNVASAIRRAVNVKDRAPPSETALGFVTATVQIFATAGKGLFPDVHCGAPFGVVKQVQGGAPGAGFETGGGGG